MRALSILSTLILLIACSGNESSDNIRTIEMKVDGMVCEKGCVNTIKHVLNDSEGVTESSINFETKTATVSYSTKKINQEIIISKIEAIGKGLYDVDETSVHCLSNCENLNQNETAKSGNKSGSSLTPEVSTTEFHLPNLFDIINSLMR